MEQSYNEIEEIIKQSGKIQNAEKEEDKIFNMIKEDFLDIENIRIIEESKERLKKEIECQVDYYKKMLQKFIPKYELDKSMVWYIFNFAKEENCMHGEYIEKCFKACKILNIKNVDELHEHRNDLKVLVFEF